MAFSTLLWTALTFVIIAIVLGIGIAVLKDVGTETASSINGDYFKNISFTPHKIGVNYTVGNAHNSGHEDCVFTLASCKVFNASNNALVPSTNYTITSPSECLLYYQPKSVQNNNSAKKVACPYVFIGGASYNATVQGMVAVGDLGSWLPSLALICVAGIIMMFLTTFLLERLT